MSAFPSPPRLSSNENACVPPPHCLLALSRALSLSVSCPPLPGPPLPPSRVSSLPHLPFAPFPCPHLPFAPFPCPRLASDKGTHFFPFPSPPLSSTSSASDEGQCLLPCSSLLLPLELALISQVMGARVPSPSPSSASDEG
ncbi:hypothetical protein BDQ17DRAFT_1436134 [Cyathus striatus]|nr:hypothetical protein BDQ17DRAFT_1436134 [Cyathus striatus]